MYIAVRADLSPGLQIAQAVHAAFQFHSEFSSTSLSWQRDSNYLVIVSVPDEPSLMRLASRAVEKELPFTVVREPDLNDQPTALALHPWDTARKLCSNLPLALREVGVSP